MTEILALENVSFRRGPVSVLTDLTLRINSGETAALIGPSGSGKSTVLRIILGLLAPERGRVTIDGETVSQDGRILVPPDRRGLAVVFQDLALWPHLTVEENLAFGLETRGTSRQRRDDAIGEMLRRVGLAEKRQRYPGQLSGGEQQRVAIARALALQPRAVLLDEPLTNLDVLLRSSLLELLRSLLSETGMTALHVTHDVSEALALDARLLVLEGGRIAADGKVDELARAPATAFIRALFADGMTRPAASLPAARS
ncbi:MAG: ABC transporter ATP-binding protein [Gemmatimonadaceae bacterium]